MIISGGAIAAVLLSSCDLNFAPVAGDRLIPEKAMIESTQPLDRDSADAAPGLFTDKPASRQSRKGKLDCPETVAAEITTKANSRQLITVVASNSSSVQGTFTAWTRNGASRCWTIAYGPWVSWLGFAGVSAHKHEGDGATPAGLFDFQATMYGVDIRPGVQFAYHHLVCGDWWDEDSASSAYNRFVHLPCAESDPPFANGSSEALWKSTRAYPVFAVINYNGARVPGLGSAIFLHADIGGPTNGCVSLPVGELLPVLKWMDPDKHPLIAIDTSAALHQL